MSYCGTNATTSRGQGQSREGAWERVKPNQRAGGVDEESIEAFGEKLDERLDQLHEDLPNWQLHSKTLPRACTSVRLRLWAGHAVLRATIPRTSRRRGLGAQDPRAEP